MGLTILNFGDIESIVETDETRALHNAMEAIAGFVAGEDYEIANLGPYAFGIKRDNDLPVAVSPAHRTVRFYGEEHSETTSKLMTVYNTLLDKPIRLDRRKKFNSCYD